ncbi:MAG: hydrogenase nickel incorporation protein HypB [Ignavibacteriales bacterium]|nr:hydrogenase nickel incorporation protein HypB [Ignavibacteriales bacterium]
MSIITIERKVLEKNDEVARKAREEFAKRRMLAINIVSSPGSGKTSILERMLEYFNDAVAVGVIEGDVQTDLDAQRIAKYDVPVVQVVTNGMCHLEAKFVYDSLSAFDGKDIRLLIIENVGNLVCPSNYDLGEEFKVVVLSTTEGDDKPLKYPAMFRNASVLLINKIDLLPYVNCNVDSMIKNALTVNPKLKIFQLSCTNVQGIAEWCGWLEKQLI